MQVFILLWGKVLTSEDVTQLLLISFLKYCYGNYFAVCNDSLVNASFYGLVADAINPVELAKDCVL